MHEKPPESKYQAASRIDHPMVWGLTLIFFAITAGFLFLPKGNSIPLADSIAISPADIDSSPRFKTLGDPPRAIVNGFERTCMDCHIIIDTQPHSKDLHQHKNINLQHGINTRCVNCHDAKDRNKLATLDNETFDFGQSAQLCAQCHGPVYRQWERGIHGKTLGYWNAEMGESQKLSCTECHDPHHPRFDAIKPLPGPNTLRMGPREAGAVPHHKDDKSKKNPLLFHHNPSSND